jgi:hypothetical protein
MTRTEIAEARAELDNYFAIVRESHGEAEVARQMQAMADDPKLLAVYAYVAAGIAQIKRRAA